MKFSKLQASGNDFVLIDVESVGLEVLLDSISTLARSMCQHRFGIGADGLILVQKSQVADLKMRIYNPDGSEAEACGNGLRCAVKYAIEYSVNQPLHHPELGAENLSRPSSTSTVTIETLSGIRQAKAYVSEKEVRRVEVKMGKPQFQPEQIPVDLTQTISLEARGPVANEAEQSPILNYTVTVKGRELALSLLSMGNPHAVAFLSQPLAKFPLARVGPVVERHSIFPQRTNFEIARVLGKGKIEARVWERGVGETLSCGSGACAIAVAAQLAGYAGKEVDIIFPGGILTVFYNGVGEVLLTGSVDEVFTGEWLENHV